MDESVIVDVLGGLPILLIMFYLLHTMRLGGTHVIFGFTQRGSQCNKW
jgi:hypothetical protein